MEEREINILELAKKYGKVSDGHSLIDVIAAVTAFTAKVMKEAEPTLDDKLAAHGLITYISDILEAEHELREGDEQ